MNAIYYIILDIKLSNLVRIPVAKEVIPNYYKRFVYMHSNNFTGYWESIFMYKFKTNDIWGFIASLFILLAWLFYLRQVDIYEPEKWGHILLTLFLSMCSIWLIYPINDILWSNFQFEYSYIPVYEFIDIVLNRGNAVMSYLAYLLVFFSLKPLFNNQGSMRNGTPHVLNGRTEWQNNVLIP